MSFSLPYSRRRRYLTGIDWSIGTLDVMTRRATGIGNHSQVVLELQGRLSPDRLRQALDRLSNRFPLLFGRVARDIVNLAPYWRVPSSLAGHEIALTTTQLPTGANDSSLTLFREHVNTPLAGPADHLRFLLIHLGDECSLLGMVFDHKLFDAFGAESFLHLIHETWRGHLDAIAPRIAQTEPAHLDHWPRRFLGGRIINRFRVRLSDREVAGLPMPLRRHPRSVRFVHDSLTPQQADRFTRLAGEECGLPILLPSAISRAVMAIRPVLAVASPAGSQCLVAVSVDARAPDRKWEDLFFNHLSFLGFSLPTDSTDSPASWTASLRDQFFDQMKQGVPAAFQDATMLTRICPQWLGARIAKLPFRGRVCSFYFTCLRDSAFDQETFLGLQVTNLIHTPRVPPPPGLGFCMTFFRGRMNLVFSYLEGVLEDVSARDVLRRLKSLLLDPNRSSLAPGAVHSGS